MILIGAGLPSFFAEAKFSGDAFRLFRWRSPDTRMQMYLETVIAREDGVKEVKLFQLGPDAAAALSRHLRQAVRRGPSTHDCGATAGVSCSALSRPRRSTAPTPGSCWRRLRPHNARRDDDVPRAVSPGADRGVGDPVGDQRHVRGQPLSLEPVRLPRAAGDRRGAAAAANGPRPGAGARIRERFVRLSGRRRATRSTDISLAAPPRREPGARRRERLRQDDADQAADATLRTDRRPDPARRPRPA